MTRLGMNLQLRRILNYETQKSFNRLLSLGGIDDFGDEIEIEIAVPERPQGRPAVLCQHTWNILGAFFNRVFSGSSSPLWGATWDVELKPLTALLKIPGVKPESDINRESRSGSCLPGCEEYSWTVPPGRYCTGHVLQLIAGVPRGRQEAVGRRHRTCCHD